MITERSAPTLPAELQDDCEGANDANWCDRIAVGLLFVGQGLGYVRWPASSFMIDETKWVYYGGAIAAVGLISIMLARR